MSKMSRIKAGLLVGLVLPTIALSSCINDLLQDVIVGVLFD